jgi:hypothetical protein
VFVAKGFCIDMKTKDVASCDAAGGAIIDEAQEIVRWGAGTSEESFAIHNTF